MADALSYALKLDNSSFLGGMDGGVSALGKLGAAASAFAVVAKGIGDAMNFESTVAQLKVLTGSQDAARQSLKEWSDFAATTPLGEEEINKAGRALLAFGVNQKEVLPTMRMLGDISSGVGMRMDELAEIFGKAKVQGRLFGEDINQLTGRGIPLISELGKVMGVSSVEVKALVEAGKVGFPEMEQAMQSMTAAGGKFSGMMAEMAETTEGKLSSLRDAWNNLVRDMAKEALPTIKMSVEAAGNGLPYLGKVLSAPIQGAASLGAFLGALGDDNNGSIAAAAAAMTGGDLVKDALANANKDFNANQRDAAISSQLYQTNAIVPGNVAAIESAMKAQERRAKIDAITGPALKSAAEKDKKNASLDQAVDASFRAPGGLDGLAIGHGASSTEARRAKVDAVLDASAEASLKESNKAIEAFDKKMAAVLSNARNTLENFGRSDKAALSERSAEMQAAGMNQADANLLARAENNLRAASSAAAATRHNQLAMARAERKAVSEGKQLDRVNKWLDKNQGKDLDKAAKPFGIKEDVLEQAKKLRGLDTKKLADKVDRAGRAATPQKGRDKDADAAKKQTATLDDLLAEVKAMRKSMEGLAAA
jgi:tape measure domain-containing protein